MIYRQLCQCLLIRIDTICIIQLKTEGMLNFVENLTYSSLVGGGSLRAIMAKAAPSPLTW